MKKFSIAFCCILVSSFLSAQAVFDCEELTSQANSPLNDLFTKYKLLDFPLDQMVNHFDQARIEPFELMVDGGLSFQISLIEQSMAGPGMKVKLLTENGDVYEEMPEVRTFRGEVVGRERSQVRLTLFEDEISGYIRTSKHEWNLQPAWELDPELDQHVYVWYSGADAIEDNSSCGVKDEVHQDDQQSNDVISQNLQRTPGECYTVEYALLADYQYYLDEGGTTGGVSQQIFEVMNDVDGNYDLDDTINFDYDIEFEISELVVSTCESCDPLSATLDIGESLNEFTAWGEQGNFDEPYDLASFWSGRNFNGSTIGLAWRSSSVICSPFRYNVLENWSNTAWQLRVLTSHEIGHNFNAVHDATSGTIMFGTINNTEDWSTLSKNAINAVIPNHHANCLADCGASACPMIEDIEIDNLTSSGFDISYSASAAGSYRVRVFDEAGTTTLYNNTTSATSLTVNPSSWDECSRYQVWVENNCGGGDFSSAIKTILWADLGGCPYFEAVPSYAHLDDPTIQFDNQSASATTYLWDFGDGNTSTSINPSHTYTNPGAYVVSLEVNGNGVLHEQEVTILPDLTPPYLLADGGDFESNPSHFAGYSSRGDQLWERGAGGNFLTATDTVWKTRLTEDYGKSSTNAYLISPRFDFSQPGDYDLSMVMGMEILFASGPAAARVEYSIDDGNTWMRLGSCDDNGQPGVTNWYNQGSDTSCSSALSTSVFADSSGWTFIGNNFTAEYPLDILEGESSVIFRVHFAVSIFFFSGYERDGFLVDDFQILFTPDGDPCDGDNLVLNTVDYPGTFRAKSSLVANGTVTSGETILQSEGTIDFGNEFQVDLGAILEAKIDTCDL